MNERALQSRSLLKRWVVIASAALLLVSYAPLVSGTTSAANTINANSCSQIEVQSRIDAANIGDTIIVPAGTCSWSGLWISGITLKGAGKSSLGGTVITGGTVTMTKHSSQITRVSGFRFTGGGRHINVYGSPSARAFIIDNNYFNTNGGKMVEIDVNGGLLHHNDFIYPSSNGTNADVFGITVGENWSQAPTFGNADSNGERNIYFEDNVFTNILETAPDGDVGSRLVIRYNIYKDSSIVFHGGKPSDSSDNGGTRQFEVYNNSFRRTINAGAINKWIWVRGSSGVIANNSMDRTVSVPGSLSENIYQDSAEIKLTLGCSGAYPMQYQVGQSSQARENPPSRPLLIFGNTGAGTLDDNFITVGSSKTANGAYVCDNADDYIKEGTDYFLNRSVQPWSWVPFTYPHPLQAGSQGSSVPSVINGQCGTTLNSCNPGLLSDIGDSMSDYLWQCMGSNGGNDSPICATEKSGEAPTPGVCGSNLNFCTSGSLNDTQDSTTHYLWDCISLNGGNSASCSLLITQIVPVCGNGIQEPGEDCVTCALDAGDGCANDDGLSEDNQGSSKNPLNNPTLKRFFVLSLKALVDILIPIVALAFIITGLLFVSARGDVVRLLLAKKFLLYSSLAAVAVIGAWVLVETVSSTIGVIVGG